LLARPRFEHRSERRCATPRGRIYAGDDLDILRHGGLDRGGEENAVADEHKARGQNRDDRFELGEILRDKRVRRRDGSVWHTRNRGAESENRMVDAVAGQDRDRPFRGETALDQTLRDASGGLARLRIGHLPPSRRHALGEEHTVRRNLRPVIEPVGQRRGIDAERMGRADQHGGVGAALDHHFGRPEGELRSGHP